MDESYTPVVKAKPERGREIKSAKMPTENLIKSVKNVVGKPGPSKEQREEMYHEGYIDGQKYLVPDSNLEAMKDMINIKMRPRRSLRYKHQTSFEISDYEQLREKLKRLLEKMETLSDTASESSQQLSFTGSVSAESYESGGTQADSKEDKKFKQLVTDSNGSKCSKESLTVFNSKQSEEDSKESKASKESSTTTESKQSTLDSSKSEASKEFLTITDSNRSSSDSSESKATKSYLTTTESKRSSLDSSESKASEESSITTESIRSVSDSSESEASKGSLNTSQSKRSEFDFRGSKETKESSSTTETKQSSTDFSESKEYSTTAESKQSATDYSEIKASKESLIATLNSLPSNYVEGGIVEGKNLYSLIPEKKINEKKETALEYNKNYKQEVIEPITSKERLEISGNKIKVELDKIVGFPSTQRPRPIKRAEFEKCRLRFLLSGHLKDDMPLFIIQEYESQSKIFPNQEADFFDSKQNENFNIAISGKFFKRDILEEVNGEPISYDITPQKIMIDKTTSRVYINSFSYVYNCEEIELTIKGKFVKHNILDLLTPMLSFQLEGKIPEFNTLKENCNPNRNDTPTTVLIYTPKYINPFHSNQSDNIKGINQGSDKGNITVPTTSKDANLRSCSRDEIDSNDSGFCVDVLNYSENNDLLKLKDTMHNIHNVSTKNNLYLQKLSTETTANKVLDKPTGEHLQKIKNMVLKKLSLNKSDKDINDIISLTSREKILKGPELKTYYQADDTGEYYSTFDNNVPE